MGGGGQNDMFAPPQYFHWGATAPRIDASAEGGGGGGEGVGRGVPPPTVGRFFTFRLGNVQSGAYLRRKFRLDDTNINKLLVWK